MAQSSAVRRARIVLDLDTVSPKPRYLPAQAGHLGDDAGILRRPTCITLESNQPLSLSLCAANAPCAAPRYVCKDTTTLTRRNMESSAILQKKGSELRSPTTLGFREF